MIREVTCTMWALFEADGDLFALYANSQDARFIADAAEADKVVEVAVTYVYDDSLLGVPS